MLDDPCIPAQHEIFCLAPAYREISELTGFLREVGPNGEPVMVAPAKVEELGVRVEMIAQDNFVEIDRNSLRQTCVDDTCIVYRMSCEALACTWDVAPLTDTRETLSRLRLTTVSASALDDASANIFAGSLIPLSALTEAGEAAPGSGVYFGSPGGPF